MTLPPQLPAPPITHGVLICSYQRPDTLMTCLAGVATQSRLPDDVIVVARADDAPTIAAVSSRPDDGLRLRLVEVEAPGRICALNVGLDACRTDILTITDDDTVAASDWLARIFDHFVADPQLGGVGGRDRCHDGERFDDARSRVVGRLQWFGRTVGNHHRGFGAARLVHFLKGANMSYRATALRDLRFDGRLRGQGSQPHDDLAFSLAVRRRGWKLLYDPAVLLDHYAAARDEPRYYVATTRLASTGGYFDASFNNVVALWDSLSPVRRAAYAVWALLIGMRMRPGLVQAVRMTPSQGRSAWQKFAICQHAHFAAYASLLRPPHRMPGAAS